MKRFQDLTRRGKIARMRGLARAALVDYRLADAQISFVRYSGNVVFRVDYKAPPLSDRDGDLYVPGRCVLRLHEPGFQTDAALDSELVWLQALRRDGLPVPDPILTADGRLRTRVEVPGVPEPRNVSLLKWVEGRFVAPERARLSHFVALGRLAARLHQHSTRWAPPAGFTRRSYDWDGLFGDTTGVGVPGREVWAAVAVEHVDALRSVADAVQSWMKRQGAGRDAFGLVHGDLSLAENVLFLHGEPRLIDFDEAAYGYWLFDLAVSMCEWRAKPDWDAIWAATLSGYRQVRPLDDVASGQIDLLIATWHAFEVFWATACRVRFPVSAAGYDRWAERAANDMKRSLEAWKATRPRAR
jgi:Ser/Thr protein kinase RdoA (MazF antagonist)